MLTCNGNVLGTQFPQTIGNRLDAICSLQVFEYLQTPRMLCEYCATIDLDEIFSEKGRRHHVSFAELCRSAENGCKFCRAIQAATIRHLESLSEQRVADQGTKYKTSTQIYLQYDQYYSTAECLYHIRFWQPGVVDSYPYNPGIERTLCYFALFVEDGNDVPTVFSVRS